MRSPVLVTALLILLSWRCGAARLFAAEPDFAFETIAEASDELIYDRSKLTGDWLGLRTSLQDGGVTVDVSTTQFYQGVASGGLEQEFLSGGRNDYLLKLDGEKAGLWQGLYITLHGETRSGELETTAETQ